MKLLIRLLQLPLIALFTIVAGIIAGLFVSVGFFFVAATRPLNMPITSALDSLD